MSFDWNAFVKAPDPQLTGNLAGAMRERLRVIAAQFQRSVLPERKWKAWLLNPILSTALQSTSNPQTISIGLKIPLFDSLKALRAGTLAIMKSITNLDFKLLFDFLECIGARRWAGSFPKTSGEAWLMWVPPDTTIENCPTKLFKLVNVKLTQEFNLDLTGKTQPSVNIDDLLFTTYHLMAACDIAFPTIQTLFQLNTVRKMMTSTSARPGTLVESSGYAKGNDALKWKDIELFMVKHPEDPKCQVLLMRVTHWLNKGKRNRGVSWVQHLYCALIPSDDG